MPPSSRPDLKGRVMLHHSNRGVSIAHSLQHHSSLTLDVRISDGKESENRICEVTKSNEQSVRRSNTRTANSLLLPLPVLPLLLPSVSTHIHIHAHPQPNDASNSEVVSSHRAVPHTALEVKSSQWRMCSRGTHREGYMLKEDEEEEEEEEEEQEGRQ
ncbi:hypothetical protein TcWFU_008374 [Taenia crassiceps]|uniref:Uncharacterized protein n=1 Tax=Taenia crassiceps TaxID=6207 RepID=A0ABR4Q3N3_9CEST